MEEKIPPGWSIDIIDVHDGYGYGSVHSVLKRLVTRRRGPFWKRRTVKEWINIESRFAGILEPVGHQENVRRFLKLIDEIEQTERV